VRCVLRVDDAQLVLGLLAGTRRGDLEHVSHSEQSVGGFTNVRAGARVLQALDRRFYTSSADRATRRVLVAGSALPLATVMSSPAMVTWAVVPGWAVRWMWISRGSVTVGLLLGVLTLAELLPSYEAILRIANLPAVSLAKRRMRGWQSVPSGA
jgi:hypothetical protein